MGRSLPLLLIHQATKQRYPLRGDLVIGRSQGDVVFDHDPKLSGKHCLIRATSTGAAIYDLKSRTGVYINGVALPNGKACVLKAGIRVTMGDQSFEVGEDAGETSRAGWPLYGAALSVLIALAAIAVFFPPHSGANPRPLNVTIADAASLDTDLRGAITELRTLELDESAKRLSREDAIAKLKTDLIPKFESLHDQLQAVTVQTAAGAKAIDVERRLSGISLGEASALANYLETNDARFATEFEEYRKALGSL